MEIINRKELINYVQEELICTIGSADAPVTIPVLITTFRFFSLTHTRIENWLIVQ
jgi:hypothetical protein